jgi:Photosynthetic reaction centre cytochrome C subunit
MSQQIRNRILLSAVVCLSAVSLTMVGRAEKPAVEIQSSSPQGQTVEQTRKNIQVLKGLPESQLFLLMNFVAVSLGERCEFCHVSKGKDPKTGSTNWVWESDEKPEKLAARRMMQMVLTINGSNKVEFRQNSVTCYTCHRGQTTTVGLPSMPLVRSGHEPGPNEAAPAAPAARPSVDEIFARYIQALGGTNATATKTLFMKGVRTATQNRSWPNEITFAAPDKFLLVATTPQAVIRQSVAGDQGWVLNGSKLQTLTAAQVANARRGWEDSLAVVKATRLPGMQYLGMEKIDGRDMYVVVKSTETKTESYDFDVATGLLKRKKTINHTAALPIPEQFDFEDYRDVDGVKLPFTIRYSAIDTFDSWTRTFSEIKRDVKVDESTFAKPPEPPK